MCQGPKMYNLKHGKFIFTQKSKIWKLCQTKIDFEFNLVKIIDPIFEVTFDLDQM